MSLVPVFEIGVWNAWIFTVLLFLSLIPARLMNRESLNKFNELSTKVKLPIGAILASEEDLKGSGLYSYEPFFGMRE